MNNRTRVAASLFFAGLSLVAQAQSQSSQAGMIYGTYLVHQTRTCLLAPESAPGQSPFTIVANPDGTQRVTVSVVPSLSENTVVYEAVVDPAKGTIVSDDVVVTGLDENRVAGSTVWTRQHRTSSSTFQIDRSNDTLLLTGTTQQSTAPNGSTIVWNSVGGGRLRTVDQGKTYQGVASDGPAMTEQTVTAPNGNVFWNSIVCDGTTRGELISRSTAAPSRR